MTVSKLFSAFDATPEGIQRLFGRVLLALQIPIALLHMFLASVGVFSPLVLLFEVAVGVIAFRIGYGGIRRRIGHPAPVAPIFLGIAALQVAATYETGGMSSPQFLLVVLTVAFAGLLLDAKPLAYVTAATGLLYVGFAIVMPQGLTHAMLDGGGLGELHPRRLPVQELAALVQDGMYLALAAFVTHVARKHLGRRWADLRQKSRLDGLTKLPNRGAFFEELTKALRTEPGSRWPLAVLMVDLDHFKLVNDIHGHAMGDTVLRQAARILRDTAGPMDHVARLGGEEFAVAALGADTDHGADLASRIVRNFRAHPWNHLHAELKVTCSVGVASLTPEMRRIDLRASLSGALEQADAALYAVKAGGRDGYHLARPQAAPTSAPVPS